MITGSCLCKAVRYKAEAAPLITRACWCRVCQYFAAGNAAISAAFMRNAVTIEGETKDYVSVADSGSVMHRRFCPTCGVPMFSEAEQRPHVIFIRVGTFDDPELVRPTATIWAASAPSWATIDATIPRIDGQPPPIA
ncbi:MAG TPA: GFA family protein [Roseiarcus sp.]|nr:GFA family protein [Roseiarcus sp.]